MCGFWMQNSDFRTRITSLCRWIDPTCGFCMQNSDFWTRVTSLYGSQTWPVVLCMYNSGINIRNTSLYGSQPSSVVFAFKTAWCKTAGPSPHVWFWMQNSDFWITNLYGSQTSHVVLCMENSIFSDQNYLSLWVPALICGFLDAKQRLL